MFQMSFHPYNKYGQKETLNSSLLRIPFPIYLYVFGQSNGRRGRGEGEEG